MPGVLRLVPRGSNPMRSKRLRSALKIGDRPGEGHEVDTRPARAAGVEEQRPDAIRPRRGQPVQRDGRRTRRRVAVVQRHLVRRALQRLAGPLHVATAVVPRDSRHRRRVGAGLGRLARGRCPVGRLRRRAPPRCSGFRSGRRAQERRCEDGRHGDAQQQRCGTTGGADGRQKNRHSRLQGGRVGTIDPRTSKGVLSPSGGRHRRVSAGSGLTERLGVSSPALPHPGHR